MKSDVDTYNNKISGHFKRALVLLLFATTIFKLVTSTLYPASNILPDYLLISITIFVVIYLWVQDSREKAYLFKMTRKLENAQLSIIRSNLCTIETLAQTLEAKDPYTRGHSERVKRLAEAIASKMNLDENFIEMLSRSALLHDIGKIGLLDEVLLKKERLTDEDWNEIKKHPTHAMNILKPLDFLSTEKDIILHHHERIDGNGYPDHLKGNDIPLGSRILAVADTFDAMNSNRPYRKQLSKEFILEELDKNKGKQHDPEIVDALFASLAESPELWEL